MTASSEHTRPRSAGRYDYLLGRKDNTAADRASATAITDYFPTAGLAAHANREFAWQAAVQLASSGVGQFIDVGCGIPAVPDPSGPNLHNGIQWRNRHATVVYVDNDPAVVALAPPRLTGRPDHGQITVLQGDLRDPGAILRRAVQDGGIDLRRPVGVVLTAVVHYLSDDDVPHAVLRELVAALPPRSGIALSHFSLDLLPVGLHAHVPTVIAASGIPVYPRSLAEITTFFDGLDVVAPGIIPVHRWRSRPNERPRFGQLPDTAVGLYCGVGRKPA
ncbi:SAM-dependent methyltransferase [Actinoplanes sp. DH11]|uniref:SAM-dependent methyltransferase n=1 Tax=Actinoplanes sp. DH11 TaxID=2857011 RepID=UPI001E2FBEDF|nr:SAM-dependent methyltransferase [Actinoplanes sp. DH11]